MEKKYKLTEESINYFGKTLYHIEALKDFGNVEKGDKGGYIEKENNLSQEGDCWINGDAKVWDKAIVSGNAYVYGDAKVSGNAKIYGNAKVYGKAEVCGNVLVFGNALIYCNALVYDNAKVYGDAYVWDNAQVYDNALVCGNAEVCGDAEIKDNSDYIVFKNWWSSGRHFTWTRSNNKWRVGCFYGNGKELIAKAYKDSELSGREYERVVNYVETILQDSKGIGD